MPSCPTCHNTFPAGTNVCPRDGAAADDDGGQHAVRPGHGGDGSGRADAAAQSASGSGPASAPLTATNTQEEAKFDSLVGAVLADRYEVVRRIGEGGMGAVYEAKHTVIGKRVAVKVLLEKFVAKSDFVARLLQEARLASSIGHEHIVDVTDFGTTVDGRSFVVMEFLDGESLAELAMREAPLPIERSVGIARQVASALGAAHAKGIFHRDVKPENIYLVKRGDVDFVKVVDFGISKAVKPAGDEGGEGYRLTHTGLLLGTPLYMSPEQARGEEDLDHRVDIWALGVLLYECLTGEVPFRANNYLGHHLAGADARADAAVEAAARAGHLRRGRGGGDARDGEGSLAPLPDDGRCRTRSGTAAGGRPERRLRPARRGRGRAERTPRPSAGRCWSRAASCWSAGAAIALDLGRRRHRRNQRWHRRRSWRRRRRAVVAPPAPPPVVAPPPAAAVAPAVQPAAPVRKKQRVRPGAAPAAGAAAPARGRAGREIA